MQITTLSILHSAIWCSLFLFILHFLRKKEWFADRYGMSVLYLLYALVLVRMLLPLDFIHSFVIPIKRVYPAIYNCLIKVHPLAGGYTFSLCFVLLGIWLTVFCILLVRHILRYQQTIRAIERYAKPADSKAQAILSEIMQKDPRGLSVSLWATPNNDTPCSVGILKKRILLPDAAYENNALRCILLHEYTHIVNRDALIKQAIEVFCMAFWWLPAIHLLKRDVEQAIEIRCDIKSVSWLSRSERIVYLESIVYTIRDEIPALPYTAIALSASQESAAITARFHAIMERKTVRRNSYAAILCIFTLLMFLSYATILQPCTESPIEIEEDLDSIYFDIAESYIVHTKTGEYWLYIPDWEPEQVSESSLPIYREVGFKIIEE